ncbi:alkane 1-monooxygenase [Jannaschia seohaensis]|uniref:Alkane 1-monooxygenase n=1 Tax=Jannaschia seohaensis TaxID=475081 RepID=A0A2Y9AA46_9RHOB|nr:alkane 1-monooxygenase [Jannaschia seohaensis]PWJ21024.1 alkane 1-monooxygenase [Jannaschia seohaensis]SSA41434.1 alkane 1-monooxygenase [Jannaschia seohaensis]
MPPFVYFLLSLGLSIFLLLAGAVADGWWDFASFLWMGWVVAAMDHFLQGETPGPTQRQAKALTVGLALLHFPLLALGVWALAQGGPVLNWLAYFIACGLFFGQIMNSNAHELIHARERFRRALGRWIYVTLLFGHHTSAHPLLHHVHVATPLDPNTARRNESWWRFIFRAGHQSFWKGLAVEKRRQRNAGRHPMNPRNPYWTYVLGGLGCIVLAYATLGLAGVGAYFAVCLMVHSQLLMTDYVLHYGMRRRKIGDKYEPVSPKHSWNTPHIMTNLLTLHAPRHSDHHAHPQRGFEALRLSDEQPMLPYSLPVMVTLALWPAYWRKMMNPRVDALHRGLDSAASEGDIAA